MIAIIDYDAGNLKSVEKALVSLGEEVLVSRDSSEILQADKVILPGVGSFGDAMNNLDKFGLVDTIKKVTGNGTPFLGLSLKRDFLRDLKVIHMCILYILIILRQQMRELWQQLRSILHIFMLRLKAAMCLHASSILKRAVM